MKAIVTGSFDPFTLGHLEIVRYACSKFDTVYVVALINETKEYMFTLEERKKIIELSTLNFENVIVDAYDGLTSDYMHKNDINYIVRGVRNENDLVYEQSLAKKMEEFDENFHTILVNCSEERKSISSTLVKERIKKGKKIVNFVHKNAIEFIKQKK